MGHKIQAKFDYGVFHIYPSWIMTLLLLENMDFLGFRMIFKVWLNQFCSNFNIRLWTTKYRLSSITVYIPFFRSWEMALLLLENRDFLGFRMICKVWLNQTFQTLNKCYGQLNTGQVRLRCIFHLPFLRNGPFTRRK